MHSRFFSGFHRAFHWDCLDSWFHGSPRRFRRWRRVQDPLRCRPANAPHESRRRLQPGSASSSGKRPSTLPKPPSTKFSRSILKPAPRTRTWELSLCVASSGITRWRCCRKAENLDPRMTGIRLNIGLVKYRREDYVGAIPPLESVVREQPNSTQARYLLGPVPALHRTLR